MFSGWGSCLVRLGGWGWVFEESTRPDQGTPTIMSVLQIVFSGWGSCLVRLGGWGWVFEESMLLWLSNRVLVGCEGGEPLVVLGGELMVVVDASLEL